jgi:hypothetical protein
MKTAGFLFTIISLGALTLGVSFADQSPGQGLDENQTTSDRSADHRDGNQKGVDKEQADTMHPNLSDSGRASEKSSRTGPIKKGILPAHRQDRPKQVTNNQGVAGEKRGDNPQSKLPLLNNFHQPGLNQPSTAVAKDGSMMNRTGNNAQGWTARSSPPGTDTDTSFGELTRRLSVGGEANASLPGVVHSRGVSTPITGQLTPSRARTSTAVLNGTGMKQRQP